VKPFQDITLDQVATRPLPGAAAPVQLRFSSDGESLYYLMGVDGSLSLALWRYHIASGEQELVAGPETQGAGWSRAEELRRERQRNQWQGITWYQIEGGALLYGQGSDIHFVRNGQRQRLPALSGAEAPALLGDGATIVFHRDGELFVLDAPSGRVRQLTRGAQAPGVLHGVADYIAQEEFGRLDGYWVSPDRQWIAYEEVDQRHVPVFPIVHFEEDPVSVEEHRYPLAGEPNARVRLGVMPLEGGETRWLELPEVAAGGYLLRVAWTPAGDLAVLTTPRPQGSLAWRIFDPARGTSRPFWREESAYWVNVSDHTRFLEDGRVLLSAELDGWRHLYLVGPDGQVDRRLTEGEWIVTGLAGVDQTAGQVYFEATKESPLERHLYRVSLEGGPVERLTTEPGVHQTTFSPDHRWYVDLVSSLEHAPEAWLRAVAGDWAQMLYQGQGLTAEALGLKPPELVTLAAADGTRLYGAIYHPEGERPAAGWPVIVAVYGGPHAQTVTNAWGLTVDLEAHYMARRGYLVFKLDNRGMANRGAAFEHQLARRFGTIELEDQVAGVEWLVQHHGGDPARIGVEGWSYGGFMTLTALMKRPDVFRVGVAGAPVTDYRFYDTGYTERYMGTPQNNTGGYDEASLLNHVGKLEGRLLIIHGLLDENVHFRNTARLLAALNGAGKAYEMLVLPTSRHSTRGFEVVRHIAERRTRFFETWL
jgi:dipeptidyl-peptidase-4